MKLPNRQLLILVVAAVALSVGLGVWARGSVPDVSAQSSSPTPTSTAFISIGAGSGHTCALRADGSVVCWGINDHDQSTPPSDETFISISVGSWHTCALRADGSVVCWGRNDHGQSTPPTGQTFTSVSGGSNHTCALRANGSVACWGKNTDRYGQVAGQATPPEGVTFVSISAGGDHTCGLLSDGAVRCWGWTSFGANSPPSDKMKSLSDRSWWHTCGIRLDGTAVCWGLNNRGQASAPTGVSFSAVTSGDVHTCGIKSSDKTALCWGSNHRWNGSPFYGQATPPDGVTFNAVSAGYNHTCGLTVAGVAVCWGDDSHGQSTPPSGTDVEECPATALTDFGIGLIINDTWTDGCFARYYTFTLDAPATVTIALTSGRNTFLYLLDDTGEVLAQNDNVYNGDGVYSFSIWDSEIVKSLDAGEEYTIEATTTSKSVTGDFTLIVRPRIFPNLGEGFEEPIWAYRFIDQEARRIPNHPIRRTYGNYWVFVPERYTSPQNIAEGIHRRTDLNIIANPTGNVGIGNRDRRVEAYKNVLLELATQPAAVGSLDFPVFDFQEDSSNKTINHLDEVREAVDGTEISLDEDLLTIHLEQINEILDKEGFGTPRYDAAITLAVKRTLVIQNARDKLDILEHAIQNEMPEDRAWPVAFREARETLVSAESLENWGSKSEDFLDTAVHLFNLLVKHGVSHIVLKKVARVGIIKYIKLGSLLLGPKGWIFLAVIEVIEQAVLYYSRKVGEFWDEITYSAIAVQAYASLYWNVQRDPEYWNGKDPEPLLGYAKFLFYNHLYRATDVTLPLHNIGENPPKHHRTSILVQRDIALADILGPTNWKQSEDFNTLIEAGNTDPRGIWSDGTTMWVADHGLDKVYAYNMSDRQRAETIREFNLPITYSNAPNNRTLPAGLWSDRKTMWFVVPGIAKIFAVNMRDKQRTETTKELEFNLSSDNRAPTGIWSNGETMWVADPGFAKIFAYNMSDRQRAETTKEFNLSSDNGDPKGIWSNGETMWVADPGFAKIFAYNMNDKQRDESREFNLLNIPGVVENKHPAGIWSDGETMWVADSDDDKIFAYSMPEVPSQSDDRAALVALYNATDGPNWTNSDKWLTSAPIGEWYGVTTDGGGRVTNLVLRSNMLTGRIPPELGDLAGLRYLYLDLNRLTGEIPSELGNLSNLQTLLLSDNRLTGETPPELGNLTNLELLFLNDNQLGGVLPGGLTRVTRLVSFSFYNNPGLCASVDEAFQSWLESLRFAFGSSCAPSDSAEDRAALVALYRATDGANWTTNSNWLSDRPIRDWHGVISDADGRVNGLRLGNNNLRGEIPSELGSLPNLETLYLYDNQLSGEIPSELGSLSNLEWLYLFSNQLSGEIPAELGSLANLELLILNDNRLSGEIPAELGSLANLEGLHLYNNQLSGEIPSELGSLANLEYLYLDHNRLSGKIPAELGDLVNLRYLNLYHNQLTGPIPSELGNLNLRWLNLSGNELTGCVPYGVRDVERNDFEALGLPFCEQVPLVSMSTADTPTVRLRTAIPVTATFSEPVSGFAVGDITVANGSAGNFVGSDGDSDFTFDVTPNAVGVVTLDIAAGVAQDSDGNGNTAATLLKLGLPYDDDHDGCIELPESRTAIGDYFAPPIGSRLSRDEARGVIGLYFECLSRQSQ